MKEHNPGLHTIYLCNVFMFVLITFYQNVKEMYENTYNETIHITLFISSSENVLIYFMCQDSELT